MNSATSVVIRLVVLLMIGKSSGPLIAADVELGNVTEKHVMIPMRDGVKLSAYLYSPKGDGPWPVLMEQRYAGFRAPRTRQLLTQLAQAGYVVAGVNFRGTQLSEGTYVGYRALGWGKKREGYDAVEWLANQRWSTGKVGSFGSSQGGYAQNFLAVTRPPHLVCQYMTDTGLSLFHEGYRIGGATKPQRFERMGLFCREPADNRALMEEWFQHPTYDDYWRAEDCTLHFDRMNVPCFTVGSWYDYMCVGSVESFVGRQHRGGKSSRGRQKLLIGPWLHGRSNKTNAFRDVKYPKNASFDLPQHMLQWFDYYLKGKDNGVADEPTVRYYVMGATDEENAPGNVWRTADDWPIPAEKRSYFLRAAQRLSTESPISPHTSTTFLADPFKPAQIPGRSFPGAQDARPFEQQSEVRTFTTAPLTEPLEWTGKVRADLYVASTARDTDFILRISDVYPDGRSILIVDMVRRARFRDGFEKETLMEPGKVYKVPFEVGWLSQIFNKGHRIRVTVASTGAPFYEPNPNTGEPFTIDPPRKRMVARNTIFHNRRYASRVLAPIPIRGSTSKRVDTD